jgi:hypothetical protein
MDLNTKYNTLGSSHEMLQQTYTVVSTKWVDINRMERHEITKVQKVLGHGKDAKLAGLLKSWCFCCSQYRINLNTRGHP